ncbi:MAG: PA0069 family radical SAM protein [Thiotrichales bacterium]|nr:PA0069 family radical SAM protein [Thiotrichales bacterium]
MKSIPEHQAHGRGQKHWIRPRYAREDHEQLDDGWWREDDGSPLATTVTVEKARTIINRNQSPDIPFEQSINPYRGCEHGCTYCYARPAHAYMDLSPGIDFETRLFAKPDAARLLSRELSEPGYRCTTIALGANTDPYQPVERDWKITRAILEVLHEYRHPVTIVTKSALVLRDLDLLTDLAGNKLVQVFLSVTTQDPGLARAMEPRAAAPWKRIAALEKLQHAGVPTGVLFAPVIPALNDKEMEAILDAAAGAGVGSAGYVLLRLPHEVRPLFRKWLEDHAPDRYGHVMSLLNNLHSGRDYDSGFGRRQTGTGPFADIIAQRFANACRKLELNRERVVLRTDLFKKPVRKGEQLGLF